jgi:hypothetical protein
MNKSETLHTLLDLTAENEVVEFKEAKNGYDFNKLGKYFSALSNEANLKHQSNACVRSLRLRRFSRMRSLFLS